MAKTVVGLMQSSGEAESVARKVMESCGCDRADIGFITRGKQGAVEQRGDDRVQGAVQGAGAGAALGGALGLVAGAASLAIPGFGPVLAAGPIASALTGAGLGGAAGGLIGALTNAGVPEGDARYFEEGLKRGGTLLTVHAKTDEMARCAATVMQGDDEAAVGTGPQQRRSATEAEEKDVMPLAEEELVVGKREVSRGNVRIYTYVTEQPAQETVQLREEHVNVERRPVDRPAHLADQAFKEQTIEVRETAEEPVVTKRARVVEEVVVRKETVTRQETIQDKVRKTDVRVERNAEQGGAKGSAYQGPERRKSNGPYSGQERRAAFR